MSSETDRWLFLAPPAPPVSAGILWVPRRGWRSFFQVFREEPAMSLDIFNLSNFLEFSKLLLYMYIYGIK